MFLAQNEEILSRYLADLRRQAQGRRERKALCEQELQERQTRLELEKKERETRLVNNSWRERMLMGMALICFLCSIGLVLATAISGEPYPLGGSAAFALVSNRLLRLHREG